MRVKICGITRAEDALLATELGAFAIGFVFAPNSPRRVSVEVAAAIGRRLPPTVDRVGVFADASAEEIRRVRDAAGLTVVQLHGGEDVALARAIGGRVIRALRPQSIVDIAPLAGYPAAAFLIDGPRSGKRAPLAVAVAAKRLGPVILAGGLRPENVSRAIRAVRPIAVDVSSGIESAPGIKDPEKMRRFFAAVERSES